MSIRRTLLRVGVVSLALAVLAAHADDPKVKKTKPVLGNRPLQMPPKGPPAGIFPRKGSPSCEFVRSATERACCQDEAPAAYSRPDSVSVTDCFGQTEEVLCRFQGKLDANLAYSQRVPRTDEEGPVSGSCSAALVEYALTCEGQSKRFTCPNQEGGRLDVYPTCETIIALNDALASSCLEPITGLGLDDVGDALTWVPGDSGSGVYTPFESDEDRLGDQGPPIQTSDLLMDPEEELPELRLEVPGNFFRFHLARSVLAPTMDSLAEHLYGALPYPPASQNAVSCNQEDLACSVNPLHLVDVVAVLDEAASDTPDLSVSADGNGGAWVTKGDARAHLVKGGSGWGLTAFDFELPGYLKLSWRGIFDLDTTRTVRLDVGNSQLYIRPTHDPEDRNGYETALSEQDSNGRWLDRALLWPNISYSTCVDARGPIPGDGEFSGTYRTTDRPYLCNCSEEFSYCLVNPYESGAYPGIPQAVASLDENLPPPTSFIDYPHQAFCTHAPVVRATFLGPGTTGTFITTQDWSLDDYLERLADEGYVPPGDELREAIKEALERDILDFACTGTRVRRIETERVVDGGSDFQHAVTSSAGLEFNTVIGGPRFDAEMVDPGYMTFEFEMFMDAERWLKKRWYTWIGGWFVDLFRDIVSAIGTILGNVALVVTNVFPNVLEIDLADLSLDMAVQAGHAAADPQTMGVGLRRVSSSPLKIRKTDFDFNISEAIFDQCDIGDYDNVFDFILELLGTTLNCARASVYSLIRLAASPLWYLFDWVFDIGDALGELIVDSMNKPVRERVDNLMVEQDIPTMLATSVQSFVFDPNLSVSVGIPGQQVFPFGHLCTLTKGQAGNAACVLEQIYTGQIAAKAEGILERVGAKTHWASDYDWPPNDYESDGYLDWNYPPVRYCVIGDAPPDNLGYSPDDLAYINTIADEIRVTEETDPLPVGAEAQCALFADLRLQGELSDDDRQLFLVNVFPTRRSEVLINRVFTCADTSECIVPGQLEDLPSSEIYQRARLAECSMVADIWFKARTDPSDPPLDDIPYRSLISALDDDEFVDEIDAILGGLGSPTDASDLQEYFQGCGARLEQAGFEVRKTRGELAVTE
jgi:hypothetical protein